MYRLLFALCTLLAGTAVYSAEQDLLSLYKYLHANPELSFQEVQTSELVARELEAAGFEVTRGLGEDAALRKSLEESGAVLKTTLVAMV